MFKVKIITFKLSKKRVNTEFWGFFKQMLYSTFKFGKKFDFCHFSPLGAKFFKLLNSFLVYDIKIRISAKSHILLSFVTDSWKFLV